MALYDGEFSSTEQYDEFALMLDTIEEVINNIKKNTTLKSADLIINFNQRTFNILAEKSDLSEDELVNFTRLGLCDIAVNENLEDFKFEITSRNF